MRGVAVLFLLLALLPARAEDWTTEDGKTYKNVTVLNQEDDGVRITFNGGVGKIPYYELPVDIQKRFGQDIDSLALKKKAVDQAMDDAVRNAILAEQLKQKESRGPMVPRPNPAPAVIPVAPGAEKTPATASITVNPPGSAPASAGSTNNAVPAPGVAGAPGAVKSGVPGAHAGPGTDYSGVAGGLNDYVPGKGGGPAPVPYAGSKSTYNQALDLCYLDSPPIALIPVEAKAKNPDASLTLRVISPGRTPEAPDRIEVTYLYVGAGNRSDANSAIEFRVDGKTIAIADSARKDSSALGGVAQGLFYLTFYLAPEELKSVSSGKDIQVSVSPELYKVDANGMVILQSYAADLQKLPKASSSLLRSYYKLLAKIPSIFSLISTACEYLILGSFGILVCFSIAAFIMGVTRFIKM